MCTGLVRQIEMLSICPSVCPECISAPRAQSVHVLRSVSRLETNKQTNKTDDEQSNIVDACCERRLCRKQRAHSCAALCWVSAVAERITICSKSDVHLTFVFLSSVTKKRRCKIKRRIRHPEQTSNEEWEADCHTNYFFFLKEKRLSLFETKMGIQT